MKRHVPISQCEICRALSSHTYVDLRSRLPIPESVARLTGPNPEDRGLARDVIQCPICGTFYLFLLESGFGEHDIELRRMTPAEAGHETDVTACELDLRDPDDETRGHAAQCLVEYYLSRGMIEQADALTRSGDPIVRSSAEASKRFHE